MKLYFSALQRYGCLHQTRRRQGRKTTLEHVFLAEIAYKNYILVHCSIKLRIPSSRHGCKTTPMSVVFAEVIYKK